MLQEDGHYTPFENAFTMTRSEQDRPSLHGQKAAKALYFSPSVQRVLNTDTMVQCEECDMWRQEEALSCSMQSIAVLSRRCRTLVEHHLLILTSPTVCLLWSSVIISVKTMSKHCTIPPVTKTFVFSISKRKKSTA